MILNEDLNGWGYIEVVVIIDNHSTSFNFKKICTMENRKGFDSSIYITLALAVVVVAASTRIKDTIFREEMQQEDEIRPIHALYFVVFASVALVVIYYLSA